VEVREREADSHTGRQTDRDKDGRGTYMERSEREKKREKKERE